MRGFNRSCKTTRGTAGNYGFGSHPYGGSVESPPAALDAQEKFGAGLLYENSVRRPDGQGGFPFTEFPWITFGGPQLLQAPSLHNIYNSVPPYIIKYATNPQINMLRSNRIRSVVQSFATKLPTGVSSALGGTS